MIIDITGYITEARGKDGFQIKVTNDTVRSLSYSDIQVSKEVFVQINKYHYPDNYHSVFEKLGQNESRRREIAKCRALCDALRVGDRVECAVFIVDTELRNDTETHVISDNHRDIKAYADAEFYLWLYPNLQSFKRLEVDSWESLKFRKQWFYTCRNTEKCEEITGYGYKYRSRWWINKNPKIIFPIIWGIRVKTAVSNLWKRFTGQGKNKSTTINTIVTIIGIVVAIIIAIWFPREQKNQVPDKYASLHEIVDDTLQERIINGTPAQFWAVAKEVSEQSVLRGVPDSETLLRRLECYKISLKTGRDKVIFYVYALKEKPDGTVLLRSGFNVDEKYRFELDAINVRYDNEIEKYVISADSY